MELDEALDFLSPNFDPVKALQATQLELPCPEVQPCDNLEQYTSLMKGLRKDKKEDCVTGWKKETHFDILDNLEQPSRFKRKTVLDFMTNPNDGPMALLQESYTQKRYVQVWIRHCQGLRGYCQGYILAFDHHLNIVLGDVTEYYTPMRTVSNKGKKPRKRKKKNKEKQEISESLPLITREMLSVANDDDNTLSQQKWELIRHVNQLFIRGDNVVLIRPVSQVENETITKDIT